MEKRRNLKNIKPIVRVNPQKTTENILQLTSSMQIESEEACCDKKMQLLHDKNELSPQQIERLFAEVNKMVRSES